MSIHSLSDFSYIFIICCISLASTKDLDFKRYMALEIWCFEVTHPQWNYCHTRAFPVEEKIAHKPRCTNIPTASYCCTVCQDKHRRHFSDKCPVYIITSWYLISNLFKLVGPYIIHQSYILTSNKPSDSMCLGLFADLIY